MASTVTAQGARPGKPRARDIAALAILSGIVGLNTVDRNMFGLLLPQIQRDIPMSDTELGFLMGPAFVIVYSIAGIPIAWLADRTGRRNIVAVGLAFWSLVTAATGYAASMMQLMAARMALGVGEASNMAPTSALIGDMFRGRSRVMAMAAFSAGGPLAIMLFYPLIGWISVQHGWRPAYPVMGAIGLVVALLTLLVVREPDREGGGEGDADQPSFSRSWLAALRSRPFVLLCAGGTMVSLNYSALLAWLPAFMLRVHGLDAAATGALLGTYKGMLGVVATFAFGLGVTLLMRADRRWLAWAPALACLMMVPAQMLLLLADNPVWWHVGLAAETVLISGITPCLFALLVTLLDPRMRATGAALYLLIFNLVGQSAGPLAIGALNDGPLATLGDEAVRYSLLAAPAAILLGAVLLLVLSRTIGNPAHEEE